MPTPSRVAFGRARVLPSRGERRAPIESPVCRRRGRCSSVRLFEWSALVHRLVHFGPRNAPKCLPRNHPERDAAGLTATSVHPEPGSRLFVIPRTTSVQRSSLHGDEWGAKCARPTLNRPATYGADLGTMLAARTWWCQAPMGAYCLRSAGSGAQPALDDHLSDATIRDEHAISALPIAMRGNLVRE